MRCLVVLDLEVPDPDFDLQTLARDAGLAVHQHGGRAAGPIRLARDPDVVEAVLKAYDDHPAPEKRGKV